MQQNTSSHPEVSGAAADLSPDVLMEEGAYCETTKRITMISPFPASLRKLVTALTIRCYDVLVFHHENDPALKTIQSDLVLIDRTRGVPAEAFHAAAGNPVKPILLVASEEEASTTDGETIVWPSPIEDVLRRIDEAAARNQAIPALEPAGQLKYRDLVMDLKRFTVHQGDKKVELTKTEYDLLRVLLLNGGGVMTREEIMNAVWGEGYFAGSNAIDVHIRSLRQKLGDDPKHPKYIATVRGVGYRIAD